MGGAIDKEDFRGFLRMYYKVLTETVVASEATIKDSKVLRRMELGEMCEVTEGPVKEEDAGLIRMKIKAFKDNVEGWVTPVGNQGTTYCEESPIKMKVVKETILTPTFDIAAAKETIRKLK